MAIFLSIIKDCWIVGILVSLDTCHEPVYILLSYKINLVEIYCKLLSYMWVGLKNKYIKIIDRTHFGPHDVKTRSKVTKFQDLHVS